jgi:hypothetical protein
MQANEIEKNGIKKAQYGKIENVAGSVWLSLFIYGSVLKATVHAP